MNIYLSEFALNAQNANLLDTCTNGALYSLVRYSFQLSNWQRYGKLLLGLRQVALRTYDSTLQNLFRGILKDVLKY